MTVFIGVPEATMSSIVRLNEATVWIVHADVVRHILIAADLVILALDDQEWDIDVPEVLVARNGPVQLIAASKAPDLGSTYMVKV